METTIQMQVRHQEEVNNFDGLFFAFNKKQLEEGKKKVGAKTNNELLSIDAGGFLLKIKEKQFDDMFKRHRMENKLHRKTRKTIRIQFAGIDSWNRPVFRSLDKPYKYYGSVVILFDYEDTEKTVLEKIDEESLCYFGEVFGCEPMGTNAGNIKIIKREDSNEKN